MNTNRDWSRWSVIMVHSLTCENSGWTTFSRSKINNKPLTCNGPLVQVDPLRGVLGGPPPRGAPNNGAHTPLVQSLFRAEQR